MEPSVPCPFCAEPIQPRAIKCKHCGEFLDGRTSQGTPSKIDWQEVARRAIQVQETASTTAATAAGCLIVAKIVLLAFFGLLIVGLLAIYFWH